MRQDEGGVFEQIHQAGLAKLCSSPEASPRDASQIRRSTLERDPESLFPSASEVSGQRIIDVVPVCNSSQPGKQTRGVHAAAPSREGRVDKLGDGTVQSEDLFPLKHIMPAEDEPQLTSNLTGGKSNWPGSLGKADANAAEEPCQNMDYSNAKALNAPEPSTQSVHLTPTTAAVLRDAICQSTLLRHVIYDTHRNDVLKSARSQHKELTDEIVSLLIARRLRGTNHSFDEIVNILLVGSSGDIDRQRCELCVHLISGSSVASWIIARTKLVVKWNTLERVAETRLYRQKTRETLEQLREDLSRVWVDKRMQADELARIQAERLASLQGMGWRTRRLRRWGLVTAILSNRIEMAFLDSLISQQRPSRVTELPELSKAAVSAQYHCANLLVEWRESVQRRGVELTAKPKRFIPGNLSSRNDNRHKQSGDQGRDR